MSATVTPQIEQSLSVLAWEYGLGEKESVVSLSRQSMSTWNDLVYRYRDVIEPALPRQLGR